MDNRFTRTHYIYAAVCFASLAVAAETLTYKPPQGFVPDEKTAIAIAEAVMKPVYGEKQIRDEEPFTATVKDDIWTINGSIPPNTFGGVATVRLSRTDGRIIYMMHGK